MSPIGLIFFCKVLTASSTLVFAILSALFAKTKQGKLEEDKLYNWMLENK